LADSNLHLSNKEAVLIDAHKPVEATAIKPNEGSSKQHGNRLLSPHAAHGVIFSALRAPRSS
jgi:hypothetical protein